MTSLAFNLPLGLGIGATLYLTGMLVVISVIDMKTLRIPDILSLPLIAAGLTMAFAVPGVSAIDHVAGAVAAYLLFAGVGEVYFRSSGIDGLGLGDAKLFAGAGAWLGWQALPIVLLLATAGGLIQALRLTKAERTTQVAFGPFISFAFWAVWMAKIFSN